MCAAINTTLGLSPADPLAQVIDAIADCGIEIAAVVADGPIQSSGERTGIANASGDDQTTLDILSHTAMVKRLQACPAIGALVSEEEDGMIAGHAGGKGQYAVVFDPLDGSSNVNSSMPTGTIFGVLKLAEAGAPTMADLLQPGDRMVAAGYVLYSSATVLAVSTGKASGVQTFAVSRRTNAFVSTGSVTVPENPKRIISANAGRSQLWGIEPKAFMESAIAQPKPYTYRYTGAMVADMHRTLLEGGVFFYPADRDYPSGKLRVLYECFPCAFLMEAAGGGAKFEVPAAATPASGRVLDIVPTSLHQRTPIFVGCNRDIALFSSLSGAKGQQAQRAMAGDAFAGSQQIIAKVGRDYAGPCHDDLHIKKGQLISEIKTYADPVWVNITLVTGESGMVPADAVSTFSGIDSPGH